MDIWREGGVKILRELLDQGDFGPATAEVFQALADRFGAVEENILSSVHARSKDRLQFLENTLERRRSREIDDITEILMSLKTSLETELRKDDMPEQLMLQFSEEERLQLRRDRNALEARLTRIDGELELESQSINARYASPSDNTFPVAVIFGIPQDWTPEGSP